MSESASEILKSNNMSVTASRQQILSLFFDKDRGALRHSDIEKQLENLDRVTIYRTLQVFTDKGLIHPISGSDGVTRYALCKGNCSEGHHHDNHVHFYCQKCGETQCLNEVQIPKVDLPGMFAVRNIEMLINGICQHCSN
jgi:Fur family ferric uptake transcriptional regulator